MLQAVSQMMKSYCCNYSTTRMAATTRYSVIFQKKTSRVRVGQKIPSSIRVAGTRWGLVMITIAIKSLASLRTALS